MIKKAANDLKVFFENKITEVSVVNNPYITTTRQILVCPTWDCSAKLKFSALCRKWNIAAKNNTLKITERKKLITKRPRM
jgi:hypothetical protein